MITFTNKHNCIFDEDILSGAIGWYATLRGIEVKAHRTIYNNNTGYLQVLIGGRDVFVHRLLIMYHLKRKLTSSEHVHHIDGNILNNVLSNLELTTNSKHTTHHHKRADIVDAALGEMLTQGRRQCDIARYFRCSQQVVNYRVKRIKEERKHALSPKS